MAEYCYDDNQQYRSDKQNREDHSRVYLTSHLYTPVHIALDPAVMPDQNLPCQCMSSTFFQAPTIAQIAALITQTEKGLHTQSLLVPLQQEGENAPFFSVHPASGYANDFTILAQHLQHNRPFYGIQAPGLDSEQETPSSVEEMATMYITAIRSRQLEGPYYLGGYSSGGLVAFEMARQLQKQGETVALLALFDTFPPLLTLEESAIPKIEQDYAPTILHMVEVLKQTTGKLLPIAYEDILHLQPEEQLAYLLKHLKTSEIIPQSTELFQLRASLQAMQAILYGSRIYRLKPYTGKITLFLSEESSSHMHVATWQQYVSNPIETYLIPGTYQLMMQMPYVATLVTHLQQSLDASRRDK